MNINRLKRRHRPDRILNAVSTRNADQLVAELDAHRERALEVLRGILGGAAES